ncbi:MAG: aldehyde:ferredoxin oxidoreductase, partial [SAR324 cluster bacterium]|nr:aldehyde:ferredoxin oxidoreductase [SAR324 cluster bacterium]
RGSEAFAAHVKGLEMPGYHPARLQTLGLGFAVGSRGADHNKSSAYDLDLSGTVDRFQLDGERIGEMINLEDQAAIIDSLILCKFVRRALQDFFPEAAEMLSALTGASFSAQDLQKSARTIHHLKKIFNRRQGWRAEEDTLPERFFAARSGDGLSEGIDPEAFRNARARYYHLRGWDDQGRPAPDQGLLEELRLA